MIDTPTFPGGALNQNGFSSAATKLPSATGPQTTLGDERLPYSSAAQGSVEASSSVSISPSLIETALCTTHGMADTAVDRYVAAVDEETDLRQCPAREDR